jgi:uncharacterized membrane protein YidH (DUF202 family)
MSSRIFAPIFKNTGSVARDHLAAERTFLSWLRTGLGFIALGIAIERFSQLDPSLFLPPKPVRGKPQDALAIHRAHEEHKRKEELLVLSMLGTGCGSIFYGTARYFSNMRLLEQGMFKPAYHGAGVLSVGVACLAGGAYWSSRERQLESREEA